MMSPAEAETIRERHERAFRRAAEDQSVQVTDFFGYSIVTPPGVQPIGDVSDLLAGVVLSEVRAGDRVLDMGTGNGVNAIVAASRAECVVAVDVTREAVDAATSNVVRNGLEGTVEVLRSDLFSDVSGTFDLIVFNPPFRWFAPRTLLEIAKTDEDYRTLTAFFERAGDHLAPEGRMLIFFGTSGDIAYLRRLFDVNGFSAEVVARRELDRQGWVVEYVTFLVTRRRAGVAAGEAHHPR